jgi:GNAT superfamily N-acetyltransferase
MFSVAKEQMDKIAPLFAGWNETPIWSVLQGHMGRAWADELDKPRAAQVIVGEFCFFAGEANVALVQHIPADFTYGIFMVPQHAGWERVIEQVYGVHARKFMRYAIRKEPHVFDREKLMRYVEALPSDYQLAQINEHYYREILADDEIHDLCSQFTSYTQYEAHGLGWVALHHGQVVGGASSYTFYDQGIEIEVDILPTHRRKGLALACAAQLILACLARDLYPSWDCHNVESLRLAEKLGYHLDQEYVTYAVTGFND